MSLVYMMAVSTDTTGKQPRVSLDISWDHKCKYFTHLNRARKVPKSDVNQVGMQSLILAKGYVSLTMS